MAWGTPPASAMKKASASGEGRVWRPRPIRPRPMPTSTFSQNQDLRSPHAVDLEQDRVCSRLSHTQETLGGPLDGRFLLSCHHERIEPVIELEQRECGGREWFLGDRRPKIHDRLGDQGVFSLGLPGHRRPDVAPRRTDIGGRTKRAGASRQASAVSGRVESGSPGFGLETRPTSSFANLRFPILARECQRRSLYPAPDRRMFNGTKELRSNALFTLVGGDFEFPPPLVVSPTEWIPLNQGGTATIMVACWADSTRSWREAKHSILRA